MTEHYEVLAIRYGTRETTKSEVFLNYHLYGEPDQPLRMDYFFWVARSPARTVVIDSGFSRAAATARDRTMLADTVPALAAAGVAPEQVSQVVLTHAHYDHTGGLPAFGAAEVLMTADEYGFWTGPMGARGQFGGLAEAADIGHLRELRAGGRLTLTGRSHQVAPGIELTQVGGHTAGLAIVTVATAAGPVILASDAAHYYSELELDRPFVAVADLAGMYAAFDQVRELAAEPGALLVAGHDPLVAERFPTRAGSPDVIRISENDE